ncbi:NAD(P)-binding domain-containing protein [Bacillus cereus]
MTGYHPDHSFLTKMGVQIDEETGRPIYTEDRMETNAENIFIAGVIAAGNNANEIFIENGRFHGDAIAQTIASRENKRSCRENLDSSFLFVHKHILNGFMRICIL